MLSIVLPFCVLRLLISAASDDTAAPLASQSSVWTSLSGSWSFHDDVITSDWYESEIITVDRMWIGRQGAHTTSFTIDYTFALNFNSMYNDGYSGLGIYNARTLSTCDYYFIGISKVSRTVYSVALFWTEQQQQDSLLDDAIVDSFTENELHSLSVTITYPDDIRITVDDVELIHYVHSTRSLQIWPAGLTGYISLWDHQWVQTTAYSLVISGREYRLSSVRNITQCKTLNPTFAPTKNTQTPTVSPTKPPTVTLMFSSTITAPEATEFDTATTFFVTEAPMSGATTTTQELYTLLLTFGIVILLVNVAIAVVLCRCIGRCLRKRHLLKIHNKRLPQQRPQAAHMQANHMQVHKQTAATIVASDEAVLDDDDDDDRLVSTVSTSRQSAVPPLPPMREYSHDDVKYEHERHPSISSSLKHWLRHKVQLPQYYMVFLRHGYETLNAVFDIKHDEELARIGIYSVQHQQKIMAEIRAFNVKRASESFKTMNSSAAQFMVVEGGRVAKLSMIEGGRDKYNECVPCVEREEREDSSSDDSLLMVLEQHAHARNHTQVGNVGEKKEDVVAFQEASGSSSDMDDSLAIPGTLAQNISVPTSTLRYKADYDDDDDLYGSSNEPTPEMDDGEVKRHILIPYQK